MNILHRLIQDNFEAKTWVHNEDISVGLMEELKEIIRDELGKNTTVEDYDFMEIKSDEIIFYFIALFEDWPSNWRHERSQWAFISFNKDTNFEEPYVSREA